MNLLDTGGFYTSDRLIQMERIYRPEQKLQVLSDCLKNWVRLEFITEVESLEVYAETAIALYEEKGRTDSINRLKGS